VQAILTTALFAALGLGGGWFFLLPVVEMFAGVRAGIWSALATAAAFGFMAATGTLPPIDP
jgi:hypothetical protein